jgi:hypothetical protein
MPLSGGCAEIGRVGGIVRVQGRLDREFPDVRVRSRLVVEADVLEIGDVGEDGVVVGLVRGVEGGGLGGLGAR